MQKSIKLGDKEFTLSSTVFTVIDYKKTFDSDIFQDLEEITNIEIKVSSMTDILLTILRIVYSLAKPNFEQQMSFDRFLQIIPLDEALDEKGLGDLITTITELLTPKKETNPNTR